MLEAAPPGVRPAALPGLRGGGGLPPPGGRGHGGRAGGELPPAAQQGLQGGHPTPAQAQAQGRVQAGAQGGVPRQVRGRQGERKKKTHLTLSLDFNVIPTGLFKTYERNKFIF